MEKATCQSAVPEKTEMLDLVKIETPGKRKVKAVCEFLDITPSTLVKTLVYMNGEEPIAVLLRGDHEVEEVKLANLLGVSSDDLRMADDKEVYDATGTPTGYLGPIGLDVRLVVDQEVAAMSNFTIGANEKNFHVQNCNMERDFQATLTGDVRQVNSQDRCTECGGALELTRGIEVGHIFKLGTVYSEKLNATFLDNEGKENPFIMGCYGIGVSRVVAAAIEQNHDKDGMVLPLPLAPVQIMLLNLSPKDEAITNAAEQLYQDLQQQGIEVIIDDRDERPGIKFKDADLIGIPYRLTVGKSFSKDGVIEIKKRASGDTSAVPLAECLTTVTDMINADLATLKTKIIA